MIIENDGFYNSSEYLIYDYDTIMDKLKQDSIEEYNTFNSKINLGKTIDCGDYSSLQDILESEMPEDSGLY